MGYKTEYDVPVIIDIKEISFDHGAVNSIFVLVFLFLISEYIMMTLKMDANRNFAFSPVFAKFKFKFKLAGNH